MAAPEFFDFEQEFVHSLRCIPMQVRLKLDTCGIKLSLAQWHQFSPTERQLLVSKVCDTPANIQSYRQCLQTLVLKHQPNPAKELAIDPNPSWTNLASIPPDVSTRAIAEGCSLSLSQWQKLTPLQRFALIKLSRPSHENNNFRPALQEFGLL